MSHTIFVHNKSGHDQTFEVHGWNNNQNMTVQAGSTETVNAPDGSSGAIIAVHDGHEGEQAEITKNGFGGNDFIDLSNIVGAGGNLTVEQVGDASTLKGDPTFMQDMNRAWQTASEDTRRDLGDCVHLDGQGNVVRIDAIKDFPKLETFVRSWADGKTYIGVGAWGGNPGDASDNNQSSAAHGNKDILVTYNDGSALPEDATPDTYTVVPGDTFWLIAQRLGLSVNQLSDANPGIDSANLQTGHVLRLKPNGGNVYYVVAGDTFWSISQRLGVDVDRLMAANADVDSNHLQTGQRLNVPTARSVNRRFANRRFVSFIAGETSSTYVIAAGDTFWSIAQKFNVSVDQLEAANPGVDAQDLQIGQTIHLPVEGSDDEDGPGVYLTNKSGSGCDYFFYDNISNGNGTAVPNFDKPTTNIHLEPGQTRFIKLEASFKGRVQRGTTIPCTWVEFQLEADNDHAAHGDISVEQGNDGGAMIKATDGQDRSAGFTASAAEIQSWGGPEAYQTRPDGVRVLASTMGNWLGGPNQAAIDCQKDKIADRVYVTGGTGVPDVASTNKRFAIEFY